MIITTIAKRLALSYLVSKETTPTPLTLRLFSNSAVISADIVASALTEVSAGNGYAAIPLTGSSWTVNPTGTSLSYPAQTWTFTGPKGNIYGYYMTNSSGTVLWAETFPAGPYNVQTNGDLITVNVTITTA